MRTALRGVRLTGAVLCGLGAVALLGSLLVTSGRPVVVGLQAFSVLAVPLCVAGLVLVLTPVGGSPGRRVVVPLAALLAAGLTVGVLRAAPSYVAGSPSEAGTPLRVLTANLRFGEADVDAVLDLVRAESPDLVVFQEITPGFLARLERAGFRSTYPHTAGLAEPGATGTMAFATAPLTDVRRIPTRHGSWAFDLGGVAVVAAHPAYPYDAGWVADQELLAAHAEADPVDLALGDFNASVDTPPFRRLLERSGLRDAAEQAGSGWQPTWPVGGFRGLPFPLAAIDHVLVGDALVAVRTRASVLPGTDHKALVADLRVPRP